jgi:alternate signal-mediated exported protein
MKKSTKGAAAAATAGVLLLGGAGTLAFWSDTITVGGDSITAGHLSLDDTTGGNPGDCSTADWTLDNGEVVNGATFDPASDLIVPGDVLTKNCTFVVNATGEHMRANLSTTNSTSSGDSTLDTETSVSSAFTIGGNPISSITEANNGQELSATITLTFDGPAATNDSQDDTITLTGYTVNIDQTHN